MLLSPLGDLSHTSILYYYDITGNKNIYKFGVREIAKTMTRRIIRSGKLDRRSFGENLRKTTLRVESI
jgi:hypothetical protein